ncbi:hypothetical protein PVAP13_5NG515586 [Panicum virgatum]|uniref:Uncharacterized protein n=1 Tax=Panicum virgatum TaxID=38727 RepID=A0A8T0S595_PANVG|nr:hypothetical protein PVAP13_5NG515586 [Panicum virgatum]
MGHSLGWDRNRPHSLPSYGLLSIGCPHLGCQRAAIHDVSCTLAALHARESYTSSTTFFHIQLPVFEIRANNYNHWIQLNPSFFSLPPFSFLSLPAPPARRPAPAPCRNAGRAPRTDALRAPRASACSAGHAPRWPCASHAPPPTAAGHARCCGPRAPHAPPRLPRATRAARTPRRRPHRRRRRRKKYFRRLLTPRAPTASLQRACPLPLCNAARHHRVPRRPLLPHPVPLPPEHPPPVLYASARRHVLSLTEKVPSSSEKKHL